MLSSWPDYMQDVIKLNTAGEYEAQDANGKWWPVTLTWRAGNTFSATTQFSQSWYQNLDITKIRTGQGIIQTHSMSEPDPIASDTDMRLNQTSTDKISII